MKRFAVIILFVFSIVHVHAQDVPGCTDPQANNYNVSATINDGSCTYNPTIYKPDFRFILPDEVDETSGLIYFADGFWTNNDSGGEPVIYKLDTLSGEVIQRVRLSGIRNIDWEELAQDDDFIYVGDIGNNSGNRDDLAIYIVAKSSIPASGDVVVEAGKISYSYIDYPGRIERKKDNNFDCEAMLAMDEYLYLFSKNRGDNKSKLYRLPKTAGEYTAELLTTFDSKGLVTGADYNEKQNELILVGYTNNDWIPFLWIMFDFEGDDFLSGNKRRIDMLNMTVTQTEAICYTHGSRGVLSSESNPMFLQTMFDFTTGQWTGVEPSFVNTLESASFDFTISPNPVSGKKVKLHFKSIQANNYQIAIYDSMGRMLKTEKYKMKRHENGTKLSIKLPGLKSGIYFVRVSSEKGMTEKKFIRE
jgi:hypothetical protein